MKYIIIIVLLLLTSCVSRNAVVNKANFLCKNSYPIKIQEVNALINEFYVECKDGSKKDFIIWE